MYQFRKYQSVLLKYFENETGFLSQKGCSIVWDQKRFRVWDELKEILMFKNLFSQNKYSSQVKPDFNNHNK